MRKLTCWFLGGNGVGRLRCFWTGAREAGLKNQNGHIPLNFGEFSKIWRNLLKFDRNTIEELFVQCRFKKPVTNRIN
jgi:hypothetical protein